MAPRTTVNRGSWRRPTSLQKLLNIAKNVVQQVGNGLEPLLTASDLVTAGRAALEHGQQLSSRPKDLEALWVNPNQDTAAYLALFFLALRRSTPCHAHEGPEFSYASLCQRFLVHVGQYSLLIERPIWGSVCCHLLAPALLRTDALQCYSRLLAQAAEQLKPAAAAVFHTHPATHPATHPEAAEFGPPAGGAHTEAALAGAGPNSQARVQERQRDSSKPQPPSLEDLEPLLRCVLQVVTFIVTGVLSCPTDDCATGLCPAGHPMFNARAQLQSSWVLEHWAQVLLLGSAVSGRSRERLTAQGRQAVLLSGLCHELNRTPHLPFADVLRRPCGCALAATHMAQLCAALDGRSAFGAAKPEVLVLPAYVQDEPHLTSFADRAAVQHDAALAESGCAVSVHASVVIVEAWTVLLAEALADGPHAVENSVAAGSEAAAEALGGRGAGPSAGRGGGGGSDVGQGPAAGHTEAAADSSLCKLPPYNRTATFQLCLRLAKGVLASWGAPLQGVMPNTCLRGPNRITPVLPKVIGSALLHQALACARLALLPAVWGRERVPRRTRAQLRAWWETYLAAAQHPDALTIATPELPDYPEWTSTRPEGVAARPSADAAAAIEAGLLTYVAWVVKRMGAPGSKGAHWMSPDDFPGVVACWRDVYQLGPLGQVGELVAAVGRRLRVAVEEQRAFAAAVESGKDWRRSRRAGHLLSGVLRETMSLARSCLYNLHLTLVYAEEDEGSAEVAAEAASGAGPAERADAAWCKQRALRSSFALAELLPPLARGVQLCAGLLPLTRRVEGQAREAAGQGGAATDVAVLARALRNLTDCSYGCASTALVCCSTVMIWYCGMPAVDWELADSIGGGSGGGGSGDSSGSGGGGGGSGSGSGGSGDGDGSSGGGNSGSSGGGSGSDAGGSGGSRGGGGAPCVVDPAWRQLLLRDVGLMELLGAGLALQREEDEAQEVQRGEEPTRQLLRWPLAHALTLSAASFPEELRAAVGVSAGAGGTEAAACGRVAGAAGGPLDSGLPGSSAGASRSCISLPAVRALMGGRGANAAEYSDKLKLVAGVLGDGGIRMDDAQRQLSDVARAFRWHDAMMPGVASYMGVLMPPEEARAAMAAAAAACAPAGAVGTS